jgi:hypothetical protein
MGGILNIEVNDYARIFMDIKNRVTDILLNGQPFRTTFLYSMILSLAKYIGVADRRPSRK